MPGPPVFLQHDSSLDHDTGAHPERAARISAIVRELEARAWLGYERLESPPAPREALTAVHPESHIAAIEWAAARGGAQIDPDTRVSPGSYFRP